jgi:hypothetical protein
MLYLVNTEPQSKEPDMSKYQNLSTYLNGLKSERWVASFADIERILGFELPKSARSYPAWWSNQAGDGHSQSGSWQSVGWRTSEIDLANERLTFVRDQQVNVLRPSTILQNNNGGLSIAEAKAALAAYYGVTLNNVEITIKG